MIDASTFRAALAAPELVQLFDYWQTLRGSRPMPLWSDIRPEEMAPVLPRIWAWRLGADDDLRLRLVGEQVLGILRRNVRGKTPEDLYPPDEAAAIRTRLVKVARVPACNHTVGDIFHDAHRVGTHRVGRGERLALPYAEAQGGFGIIGASKATLDPDPDTGLERPFDPQAIYTLKGPELFMRIG